MKVNILSKGLVLNDFFKVEEAHLQHEKYDGTMSEKMRRLNFERGDSVVCLLWVKDLQRAIFTEQFRYPAYTKGEGWLLEAIAGSCKPDEDPVEAMKRELLEEVGYQAQELKELYRFFVSPGGTSERITLYYAEVTQADKIEKGGGLASEHEDIRIVGLSAQEMADGLATGRFQDAKTLLAIQWFLYVK